MGSGGLILSAYEQMQAAILPLCVFFLAHHPNASSSHLRGLLAPKHRSRLGHQQVGAQRHVVQASQGCFHHLQARLAWALRGVERDWTQPLSPRSWRPGQGVAVLTELPEGDDTAGGGIASHLGIRRGFIRKAVLEQGLEGEKH